MTPASRAAIHAADKLTDGMNVPTRFFIYAPFALFVALMAGVSLRWFSQAEALSRHLDELNGHAVMPGVTMHFSSKQISGFPFRLDAVFGNFELDIAVPRGGIGWRSDAFALHRLTYGADTTVMESSGWQRLSVNGNKGAVRGLFAFQPGSMRASAVEVDARLRRFDLVIVGLAGHAFCLTGAEFHFRSRRSAADIEAQFQGAASCQGVRGPPYLSVLVSATLLPEPPLADLENGQVGLQPALEAFRTSQGRVLINRVELSLPSALITGSGKIGFDFLGRPAGTIGLTGIRLRHSPPPRTSGSGQLATALENALGIADRWPDGAPRRVLDMHDGAIFVDGKPLAALSGL